jgi:hypothetical protein
MGSLFVTTLRSALIAQIVGTQYHTNMGHLMTLVIASSALLLNGLLSASK